VYGLSSSSVAIRNQRRASSTSTRIARLDTCNASHVEPRNRTVLERTRLDKGWSVRDYAAIVVSDQRLGHSTAFTASPLRMSVSRPA
jgi:hypothetical protein